MSRIPEPGPDVSCSPEALRRRFPDWTIGFDCRLWVWTATKRTGSALHFVADHTPSALGASLERIEGEDAARWVTSASGPDYRVTP